MKQPSNEGCFKNIRYKITETDSANQQTNVPFFVS